MVNRREQISRNIWTSPKQREKRNRLGIARARKAIEWRGK